MLKIKKGRRAEDIVDKKKDRQNSAEIEAPPNPVAGDTLRGHQTGDQQWGVGGESRGHHGSPGEPPGNAASGDEELFRVSAGAAAVVDADQKIDQQVSHNHDPIGGAQGHKGLQLLINNRLSGRMKSKRRGATSPPLPADHRS